MIFNKSLVNRIQNSYRLQSYGSRLKSLGIIGFAGDILPRLPAKLLTLPLYPLRVRFLSVAVTNIGHLAIEPDAYLKAVALGRSPKALCIILAAGNPVGASDESKRVCNQHLLDYWKTRFVVIESERLCNVLDYFYRFGAITITDFWEGVGHHPAYHVLAEYGDRPPMLRLTDADHRRGRENLRRLGVPDDAWFVCVHCRESGYRLTGDQGYRNVNIEDYALAMESIVGRGGWCVRVGDPSMTPLAPMRNVVDYVHSDCHGPWMDVYLAASCRFFLGCDSGLFSLATVFGVPVAVANMIPLSCHPYHPHDLAIYKLLRSREEERYLGFPEIARSPLSLCMTSEGFNEAGVDVIDNTPEDVRDLVEEMLDRVEGDVRRDEVDEGLGRAFKALFPPDQDGHGSEALVGRAFLKKYAHLLGCEGDLVRG